MKKENVNADATKKIKKTKKNANVLGVTTISVIVVVLLCCAFAWYQIYNLENGILDVCATQQDAYVQLVVDQINLKENRDDEEIINDILSTLDSSTSKYWTFSKDRSMLFVKDIIETNRYKGLTTITYYDSESAKEFLESLQKDRVIHKSISIDGKDYVASGVAFSYGGDDYRLCLLTNRSVILNNNKFMSAKLEIIILVGLMMVMLMAVSMLFARRVETLRKTVNEKNEFIVELQGMVGELNELLSQKEHYDTRYQLWSRDSVKEFLEKLKNKGLASVYVAKVHFTEERYRHSFLDRASMLLDKKVLRFVVSDSELLLMYLQYSEDEVDRSLEPLLNEGVKLKKIEELMLQQIDCDAYVEALGTQE